MCDLTQHQVQQLFDYRDGFLYWKVKRSNVVKLGKPAGNPSVNGYWQVSINRKRYYAHRVIYLYHFGFLPKYIDHIDCNRQNNLVENLRGVTSSQNKMNEKRKSNNKSGYKGVSWCNKKQKWEAKIMKNYKSKFLGYFDCPREAHLAYRVAADKEFCEYKNYG